MPLHREVGLSPGHVVKDGDPPPPIQRAQPPIFGPCLLWPNGRPSQLLLSTCSTDVNSINASTVHTAYLSSVDGGLKARPDCHAICWMFINTTVMTSVGCWHQLTVTVTVNQKEGRREFLAQFLNARRKSLAYQTSCEVSTRKL